MYFYGIDTYYLILVLPAVIFAAWAQFHVNSTFKKYSKKTSEYGMTGADAARLILTQNGLGHVTIGSVAGQLTDHYDPQNDVINLSESTRDVRSAAAVGVAAHEAGHAIQYAEGYLPIKIRQAIIPATKIGSTLSMPLVIAGLIFSFRELANIGILLFGISVFFQLVTLPVEFNASRRAVKVLEGSGMLSDEGLHDAKKVLRAAALTYVAALFVALMNMLRLIILVNGNRRRD